MLMRGKPELIRWAQRQDEKRKQETENMCKVLALVGVTDTKAAWDFAVAAKDPMTQGTEKDGFGYAAMLPDGTMFGERWMDVADAFKERYMPSQVEADIIGKFGAALVRPRPYNSFGTLARFSEAGSILVHSRYATSPKTLPNIHPFVDTEWNVAMIHNGVIGNYAMLENRTSTCDSETILNAYTNAGVMYEPREIQDVADKLVGSYACAFMGTDNDSVPYVDMFRNNTNPLIMCKVKEVGGVIFCTNLDIIKAVCGKLNMTLECFFYVLPGQMVRMNAMTAEPLGIYPFDYDHPSTGNTHTPRGTGVTSAVTVSPINRSRTCGRGEVDDQPFTSEDVKKLLERQSMDQ